MGAQNHYVTSEDLNTLSKLLGVALQEGDVIIDVEEDFQIKAHALTEVSINPVNTAQVADQILRLQNASLISFVRSALFTAALKNTDKKEQAVLGMLFSIDDNGLTPTTDIGDFAFDILFGHKSGTVRTFSAFHVTNVLYKFESRYFAANAANVAALPYFGPLKFEFVKPLIVKRAEGITEYISHDTTLWRIVADATGRWGKTAHTAVSTYDIKVRPWIIMCDVEDLASYSKEEIFVKLAGV
jgi:hypothetical protein